MTSRPQLAWRPRTRSTPRLGVVSAARVWLAAGALALCGACVNVDQSAEQARKLRSYVLDAAPANVGKVLNIDFDGKLMLLGAQVEPWNAVRSGERVKVTMYWKCAAKLTGRWSLFSHILDSSGERLLNIDNVGPLREWVKDRQALAPGAWEPGKVYVDEQLFEVPANVSTSSIQLVTGVWQEQERLRIVSGPHDSENRALVATIAVNRPKPKERTTRVPELQVPKLAPDEKLDLDGRLNEPAWQRAADTGAFVSVADGETAAQFPVQGRAKLLWNPQGLYIAFQVQDKDIVGGFKANETDPHLWTRDTVEIMIDPDGDGDNRDYYEIQINPQNLVFDSQFDDYNQPRGGADGPFGHQEWSAHLKSAVLIEGTIDQSGDVDNGYAVEAFLPWKSFSKAQAAPPLPGASWRMNFYAMQNNGGVAWSPILGQGNFHKASRFGKVTFLDVDPKPAGAAPTASAPTPPMPASATSASVASSASAAAVGAGANEVLLLRKRPGALQVQVPKK